MASDAWAHAFAYTLANEGSSYVEDPSPTLRGITLQTLSAWRGRACTAADVRALSLSETQQIYKATYWDRLCGDQISNEAIATAIFDTAANSGVATAAKLAQGVVGAVADGNLGPQSLAALNACPAGKFMLAYVPARLSQYLGYVLAAPAKKAYLKTWLKRAALYLDLVA